MRCVRTGHIIAFAWESFSFLQRNMLYQDWVSIAPYHMSALGVQKDTWHELSAAESSDLELVVCAILISECQKLRQAEKEKETGTTQEETSGGKEGKGRACLHPSRYHSMIESSKGY